MKLIIKNDVLVNIRFSSGRKLFAPGENRRIVKKNEFFIFGYSEQDYQEYKAFLDYCLNNNKNGEIEIPFFINKQF